MKGYLLKIYLWTQGTYIIHNMRVMNNDATFYQSKPPDKFLENFEKAKKNKYIEAYIK